MIYGIWLVVSATANLCCCLWFFRYIWRSTHFPVVRFTCVAIFCRFLLAAFHPLTYPPLLGPFSIVALYSVVIIAVGWLLIDRRLLGLRFLLPVYGLILLIIASAIYNSSLNDAIQPLVKWLFFIVLSLAAYESFLRISRLQALRYLYASFCIPITLQWLSVVTGYSKATENDGSVSFIGGFNHEAVFSVALLTAMCVYILSQTQAITRSLRPLLITCLLAVGIFLANYRTTILAMLVPVAGFLYLELLRGSIYTKITAAFLVTAGLATMTTVDFGTLWQRFSDLGHVLTSATQLIKPPAYYTDWEQDYFSSRVYFWSEYINAYLQGNTVQHLIGYGADTWEHHFPKYAHNTFVSTLYELGALGVLILGYFFLRGIRLCFARPFTSHGFLLLISFIGFFISNLGTMPLWQIEGLICFAILNALAWEQQVKRHARTDLKTATAYCGVSSESTPPILREKNVISHQRVSA